MATKNFVSTDTLYSGIISLRASCLPFVPLLRLCKGTHAVATTAQGRRKIPDITVLVKPQVEKWQPSSLSLFCFSLFGAKGVA